jgi:hypothetical protein
MTEKQQMYKDMLEDAVSRDTIYEQTDYKFEGFKYCEDIDYDRDEIYERCKEYPKEYIDEKIDNEIQNSDNLTIFWEDNSDQLNRLEFPVLEYAERLGYISNRPFTKTRKDGTTYEVYDNVFKSESNSYDATIYMDWDLPNNAEDMCTEYDDIEYRIESEEYEDVWRDIIRLHRRVLANERAISFIDKAETRLGEYFKDGFDITEDIIYRIQEEDDLEDYTESEAA